MKKTLVLVLLSVYLQACGSAQSDDLRAQRIPSDDGSVCYAIIQNGKAIGGSCK